MTQDTVAAENMTIPTRMPTSQLIPDNIVRMARINNMRNISGINAKFQFSKVKLRSNKPQLPPYYENNNLVKKIDLSTTTTSSSPPLAINYLDFHAASFIILLMFSVTAMMNMLRTIFMPSTQSRTSKQ